MVITILIIILFLGNILLGYFILKNYINIQRNASSIKYNEIHIVNSQLELKQIKKDILNLYDTLELKDIRLITDISKGLKRLEREITAEKGKLASTNNDLKEAFEGIYGQINQLQQRMLAISKDDGSLSRYT